MRSPVQDSPFGNGRGPPFLVLVADNGIIVGTIEDPPNTPESLVGTLDPSITPAIAAADVTIVATDSRPLPIRLVSRLISTIAVIGEVVRMGRTIPDAVASSWHRATSS